MTSGSLQFYFEEINRTANFIFGTRTFPPLFFSNWNRRWVGGGGAFTCFCEIAEEYQKNPHVWPQLTPQANLNFCLRSPSSNYFRTKTYSMWCSSCRLPCTLNPTGGINIDHSDSPGTAHRAAAVRQVWCPGYFWPCGYHSWAWALGKHLCGSLSPPSPCPVHSHNTPPYLLLI